ncbi:MAG: DUF1819 family protein [Micrococcales bacterium]|nr:DUF1819 family protein [Micrococcales bacterium]
MTRYKLSFTTGGLLATEARITAPIHRQTRDWLQTRAQLRDSNPLGIRTAAAVTRVSREIVDRLQTLNGEELGIVEHGSAADRNAIMWVAVTRQYRLIHEFATEVLRDRFVGMTPTIELSHFDTFLVGKAAWSPEIADLTDSTRRKLRQNLFRMMREADLMSPAGGIIPALLSAQLTDVLRPHGREGLEVFPMTDDQISRALR